MATMVMTRASLAVLLLTPFLAAGCMPEADGSSDRTGTGTANLYDHESLLARPPAATAAPDVPAEFQAELDRLPVPYDPNNLPVIYDKDGELRAAEMPAGRTDDPEANLNPSTRAIYTVGGGDWVTYWYIELLLPSYMTDADGGTIRLVMQHEVDSYDQVRIIDEHIGTEYVDNSYGARGRYPGRYGWTRQSGGGDHAWVLGDGTTHNLANPWDWAWILDYRWLQGNSVLGGDWIRVYSHPHVTTRVVFMD